MIISSAPVCSTTAKHVNRLVREWFPKGTEVQARLNARPRKILGYLTPAEALGQAQPP